MTPRRAVVLAATAAVLAGCLPWGGSADPEESPEPVEGSSTAADGGTLRWALGADPTSLDPARIVGREDELVVDVLFDSLTRLDADLAVQPALATSWSSDDTAMVWRFELDPDAQWSDGTQVVAEDVVRGLTRVADGSVARPSIHGSLLGSVQGYAGTSQRGDPLTGVVAVDDATVEVTLSRPDPALPVTMAHPALAPVPPVATDDPAAFGEAPVGNGPFALGEWAHNQFLRLVPAPGASRPPALAELVFRVYADDSSGDVRWGDLRSGQVQVTAVPVQHRGEVPRAVGADALRERELDVTTVMMLATDRPLLDDLRFRRAIALSIDREAVAGRTNGARAAADRLAPASLLGTRARRCDICRHAPSEAEDLVAEVLLDRARQRLGPAPTIRILTADDLVSTTLAEQVRASLRQLGVPAVVDAVAPTALPSAVQDREPSIVVLPWTSAVPTAESFVVELTSPGSLGRDLTRWRPASATDLVQEIWSTSDAVRRWALVADLEEMMVEEAVVLPLLQVRGDLAVSPLVSGLRVAADGSVDIAEVMVDQPS